MRVVALAVVILVALGGWRLAVAGAATPRDVATLAVLDEHVAYQASLIGASLPRLPAGEGPPAAAAADVLSSLGTQLGVALRRDGYPPARALALWDRAVGNGAPPPSHVLLYVCSVHTLQSDGAALSHTPVGSLAEELSGIELTLLVEGRQLAAQLGGTLGAATDTAQRDALHLLAPLLVPSDRAFAASA